MEVGESAARFINDIGVEGGGIFAAAFLGERLVPVPFGGARLEGLRQDGLIGF